MQPLASATAVWFSGGRQFRLVNSYKDTRTERELRAVFDPRVALLLALRQGQPSK